MLYFVRDIFCLKLKICAIKLLENYDEKFRSRDENMKSLCFFFSICKCIIARRSVYM